MRYVVAALLLLSSAPVAQARPVVVELFYVAGWRRCGSVLIHGGCWIRQSGYATMQTCSWTAKAGGIERASKEAAAARSIA